MINLIALFCVCLGSCLGAINSTPNECNVNQVEEVEYTKPIQRTVNNNGMYYIADNRIFYQYEYWKKLLSQVGGGMWGTIYPYSETNTIDLDSGFRTYSAFGNVGVVLNYVDCLTAESPLDYVYNVVSWKYSVHRDALARYQTKSITVKFSYNNSTYDFGWTYYIYDTSFENENDDIYNNFEGNYIALYYSSYDNPQRGLYYEIGTMFYNVFSGDINYNSYYNGYDDGYDAGFQNGVKEGNQISYDEGYSKGTHDGYQSGFDVGEQWGYQDGIVAGREQGYQTGYTAGYTDGVNTDQTASAIFTGILDVALVPVNFFLEVLNFEVFGINISGFVSSLLTVAIVVIIIRTFLGTNGGGKDD